MTHKDSKMKESFEKIESELSQYIVKYPDEFEIDATINSLRQYVPSKNNESIKFIHKLKRLFEYSKSEVSFINKSYWIVSIILFVLGYIITYGITSNPFATLITLAPVPFLLGLLEVFKGRDQGLMEMEMTCKFSANEIMLSRLLIISLFNLLLNTLLTVALLPLIEEISFIRVLLLWFTPFTLFTALSLWISMKFKGNTFVMTFLPIWLFLSILLTTDPKLSAFILGMHTALHFLFVGLGIFMFAFQLKQVTRKYSKYEGIEVIGINH